jgi:hypothetical protein
MAVVISPSISMALFYLGKLYELQDKWWRGQETCGKYFFSCSGIALQNAWGLKLSQQRPDAELGWAA